MKKSRNSDDDFIEQLLDTEHIVESDLRPATLEPVRTGLTKRQQILKGLVDAAASGDVSATKLLLKITDNKL